MVWPYHFNFSKAVSYKFYLVHSWILCLICHLNYNVGTILTFVLTNIMPLVSFFTTLKTSGNQWFPNVFRSWRKGPVTWTELISTLWMVDIVCLALPFYLLYQRFIVVFVRVKNKLLGSPEDFVKTLVLSSSTNIRSTHRRCSVKKVFLEISLRL